MASSSESISVVSRFRAAWAGREVSIGRLSGRMASAFSSFSEGTSKESVLRESTGAMMESAVSLMVSKGVSMVSAKAAMVSATTSSMASKETSGVVLSEGRTMVFSLVVVGAGVVLGFSLMSDEGVQAHSRMKASTKMNVPVFCLTAAKLHNFWGVGERMELKGVKVPQFLRLLKHF